MNRDIIHKISPLEVAPKNDNSQVVFNIIISSINFIVLELFWLQRYNPYIDLIPYKIEFLKISQTIVIKPNRKFHIPYRSKIIKL